MLVFFYDEALKKPLGPSGEFAPARHSKHLPVVLTRAETNRLMAELTEPYALMAGLLYGGGLRLMECIRLRIMDVDFELHREVTL